MPTITQFELFASKSESKISIYLQNEFRSMGINIDSPISYEVIEKWIYKDHNIYLNYSTFSIIIATSLIHLDDVEFVDNLPTQQQAGNFNNMNRKIFFFIFNFFRNGKTCNKLYTWRIFIISRFFLRLKSKIILCKLNFKRKENI